MNTISHDERAHQFNVEVDGHRGVLDYTLAGRVMRITHTGVPGEIGGRGVAANLMKAAVDAARVKGWSIDPICAYAVTYLARHPEAAAIQHREELLDEALEESFPASDSPSVGGIS